nr:hypothetical protein [Clostridia bacterium]
MRRCNKCGVNVRGSGQVCPLCQSRLTGEAEPDVFPSIPTVYSQFEMLFKLLIFITVSGGLISVALDLMIVDGLSWSVFVLLGIVCFWVLIFFAVRKRNNIPKNITYQVVLVGIISVVWDFVTGWYGWSIDFVIPIACVVAITSLGIIGKVLKMPSGDYIFSMIADGLFGIIPMILYALKLVHIIYPSIICFTLSLISIASLLIFDGSNIVSGMKKRMHL